MLFFPSSSKFGSCLLLRPQTCFLVTVVIEPSSVSSKSISGPKVEWYCHILVFCVCHFMLVLQLLVLSTSWDEVLSCSCDGHFGLACDSAQVKSLLSFPGLVQSFCFPLSLVPDPVCPLLTRSRTSHICFCVVSFLFKSLSWLFITCSTSKLLPQN